MFTHHSPFLIDAKAQIKRFSSLANILLNQVITKHPSLFSPYRADIGAVGWLLSFFI